MSAQSSERQIIHLNRFISQLEPALHRAAEPGTLLTMRLSPSGNILGNSAELEMALLTLVSAAREAMASGGELTIDTGWLDFVAFRDGAGAEGPLQPHARITVSDTGHGIRQKARARIFDPFVVAGGGLEGLELPSVAGIVRRHGGWIGLESQEGTGTRIHVCIPFAPGSEQD